MTQIPTTSPDSNDMPSPSASTTEATTSPKSWTLPRAGKAIGFLVVLGAALWYFGPMAWEEIRDYQETLRSAEDTVPIGYLGTNYRRSYHDKPAQFHHQEGGRKLLWAAKKEDGQPEFYDVTDADIPVMRLSGGFGRDSIPGIDAPIFEGPSSERWSRLHGRQDFYGLIAADGPRSYPAELLRKIEVVNDRDQKGSFVIVFDRARKEARFYAGMLDGQEVTFGTTGYSYGLTDAPENGQPLLYDRTTRSLWLPEGENLVCVSGKARGTKIPEARQAEKTTWSAWQKLHPETRVLMGGDRSKPIPSR